MEFDDLVRSWKEARWAPLVERADNFSNALLNGAETATQSGRTFGQLLASLAVGATAFGAQFVLFNLLRTKLKRIYFPKSYMVPEKERVPEPRGGAFGWLVSIIRTSNSDFISKCGLDAYFYLRYLRMLLKLFLPVAIIFIPVLLPVNHTGITDSDARGIDQFAWQNITAKHTDRFWVHLVAAVCLVAYFCYVVYQELRGYIRIRQAYLTSPQHRIKASATTVLVTNIPRKWLTKEELDGLYDVFPGGVRNIWINRNYDELDSLVQTRDDLALTLEGLYVGLLEKAQKKHTAQVNKGPAQHQVIGEEEDRPGMSVGNPHQIAKNLDEALGRRRLSIASTASSSSSSSSNSDEEESGNKLQFIPGMVTGGLEAVGQGLGAVGHGVGKFGHFVKDLGKGRKDGRRSVEDPPRKSSQTDGTDYDQHSPTYSTGEGLMSVPSRRTADGEADDIPLRDMGKPRDSEGSNSRRKSTKPSKKPSNQGIFASIQGAFQNSLEEDMPTKQQIIRMTQEATVRRQQLLQQKAPTWSQWLTERNRETFRLHTNPWINWIPFTGIKLDAIDYYTVVLSIYNEHIERLQEDPERFPLMNSAFIQFNHQVAAHMACQSLNHHMPLQMAPRTIEISPDDVAWGNLSIPWWMRYIRTALVLAFVIGLIILWAPMVTLTSLIGQLSYLTEIAPFLNFINKWPSWVISAIQGVLPPVLLSVLLLVLPMIFRALSFAQGSTTGNQAEMSVQNYFFAFLFIQLFLIVTISGAIVPVVEQLTTDFTSAPAILARNLPKSSNYFISYIILQAFSVSASTLLQVGSLLVNYIWSSIVDNSPRAMFARATTLPQIKWGSFFPIYTNLAVIGLVYSVVSPIILIFNLCTFSLFWIAHRYNALYVNQYKNDTGGLLFPRAINQLFIGIYTLELCLIGLFFLQRDAQGEVATSAQAIIMIIVLILTAIYQVLLNRAFEPLFRYIPITMEDDAVRRDEEFAAIQARRFEGEDVQLDGFKLAEEEKTGDNLQSVLREREERELQESGLIETREKEQINAKREQERSMSRGRHGESSDRVSEMAASSGRPGASRRESSNNSGRNSWAKHNVYQSRHSVMFDNTDSSKAKKKINHPSTRRQSQHRHTPSQTIMAVLAGSGTTADVEKQQPVDDSFFYGINDELEDLTQEERDILVDKAFKHRAARATRPAIWIPKDRAGVSEFEIEVIASDPVLRKYIWISDEGAWLDEFGKVKEEKLRRPPDFNEEKLITL